ncbi:hypothetical protein ACFL3H_07370 [Gemmatimonadota bacterium]
MSNRFSTQLEILSGWITSLQYEDIPERVVFYAKLQLLDCVAAICTGGRSMHDRIHRREFMKELQEYINTH